ncbi:SDR family oxidoreductase [Aureimonas leprariae]|uniref:SDR family oxidoreductase n=1 Tax=Plantimonas leprariae TaxID=2615207 RepID=A0A7V7TXT6_9HYPH|nr:SDR family oxidoreductase [Aureimonas leprariae]KAB0676103.1 SDR family oxidoreductase [Aureimonas leprariae]
MPEDTRAKRFFVFGCGYSGAAFAATLAEGELAGVTTRSAEKAAEFAARGWKPFVFDGTRPGEGIDAALGWTTHLLVSIAPGGDGDPTLRFYRDRIARGMPELRWIGYLSTVGVYGDHGGAWVSEETPVAPRSERSRQRVDAERAWEALGLEAGVPMATLRLSGIYGPGRNAFVNLREGKAKRLLKPGQVFNRIHVADIAGAIRHLADRNLGGVFNVTDDEPAPPQDVVEFAAKLAGIEPPPAAEFSQTELSPMVRSFYEENKRVSNARMKGAGYTFSFPTYRDALPCLAGDAAFSPSPNIS